MRTEPYSTVQCGSPHRVLTSRGASQLLGLAVLVAEICEYVVSVSHKTPDVVLTANIVHCNTCAWTVRGMYIRAGS